MIGCGNSRAIKMRYDGGPQEWENLITLDVDPACKPDVIHDLTVCPYPFKDNMFDDIHAYEVLEHCGKQGDWRLFFRQFEELWRILKPGGLLVASVPMWDSIHCWSDPGHTRVITKNTLVYLNQSEYADQIGRTAMTDYRSVYKGNFEPVGIAEEEHSMGFVLKAVK